MVCKIFFHPILRYSKKVVHKMEKMGIPKRYTLQANPKMLAYFYLISERNWKISLMIVCSFSEMLSSYQDGLTQIQ